MNNVCLVGNMTRDPEIKHLPSGTIVCEMGVAVNDRKPDGNGGYTDYAHFFDVTCFGKLAENCGQYLSKGKKVGITGKLEQQRWEADDGSKRSRVKITAFNVEFLTPKDQDGSSSSQGAYADEPKIAGGPQDDDIPF